MSWEMQSCHFSQPDVSVTQIHGCVQARDLPLYWGRFQQCAPIAKVMSQGTFTSWPGRATFIRERINQGCAMLSHSMHLTLRIHGL